MTESIRKVLPSARDQGERPTCLSFALTAAHGLVATSEAGFIELSEEMLHQLSVLVEGSDRRVTLPAATSVLLTAGQCQFDLCPYLPTETDFTVSAQATADALERRAKVVEHEATHKVVCDILRGGTPVLLVLKVCHALFVTASGHVPLPNDAEVINELHAVLATGISQIASQEVVKFRNSWGTEWGDSGYGYLPFEYIDKFCRFARTLACV